VVYVLQDASLCRRVLHLILLVDVVLEQDLACVNKAEQNRTKQNKTEQSKINTRPNNTKQNRAEQNRAEQNTKERAVCEKKYIYI
jgi:hypothetical protein